MKREKERESDDVTDDALIWSCHSAGWCLEGGRRGRGRLSHAYPVKLFQSVVAYSSVSRHTINFSPLPTCPEWEAWRVKFHCRIVFRTKYAGTGCQSAERMLENVGRRGFATVRCRQASSIRLFLASDVSRDQACLLLIKTSLIKSTLTLPIFPPLVT